MKNPNWAAVFDFDGTLIPSAYGSLYDVVDSSREVTAECHRKAEEMRRYYLAKAQQNKLSKKDQEKWLVDSLNLYIESGLTLGKIEKILSKVKLRPGVLDCLEALKKRKIPVAVVSYGVFNFIDAVLRVNGARNLVQEIYSARLKADSSGLVTGFSRDTFVFPFNKGKFSRNFADRCFVRYDNLLAVGDSPSGDKLLGYLKRNRLGIAGDDAKKERLLRVMGDAVVTEDFRPVTDWLLKKIDPK